MKSESTRRVFSTRRFNLRRAVERGDPRLGLVVGVVLASLSALAFARPDKVGVAETLELKALDFAFRHRDRIDESDQILMVDIDDRAARELTWPIDREDYARAILVLDRLGAARIVPDVEFKTIIPQPDNFNPETGDYLLATRDKALRFAIERTGKVTLAYSFDLENPLPPELAAALPKLKDAFAKKPGADAPEISRLSGVPAVVFEAEVERMRQLALLELVAESMDLHPKQTFAEIRASLLPDYDPVVHKRPLKLLQYAYWMWRCGKLIDEKAAPGLAKSEMAKPAHATGLLPPLYPFLEHAQAVGCVNAAEDSDGVRRRTWTHVVYRGRSYAYLGIEAGSPVARKGTRVYFGDGGVLGPQAASTLPLDRDGRFLLNWAGNAGRLRGEFGGHMPITKLLELFQVRYVVLDAKVRRLIEKLDPSEREGYHAKYLETSDRLVRAFKGEVSVTPLEARALEARMDEIRGRILKDYRSDIAQLEEVIRKNPDKSQLIKNSRAAIADRQGQIDQLEEADKLEKSLRARVDGRICFIGSSYTASGDLHATPLAGNTPGVDVLANVSNMLLTGQTLRRVPAAANFFYLFLVGLLVSYYVTHGSAAGSSAATLVTMVLTGALGWLLFTRGALLISAAGPFVTSILTFAGVTTYKELLTQRSKRKLQRELEKNTSPELVKIILEHPEFLSEPRRMTGTFFFSDVKSFTSISEKMNADILFPFINRYLDCETQALKSHLAFVDKYIGDGIMALFGIPVPNPAHAVNACKAALDCQAALKPLNAENQLQGLPMIKARIGIHSGEASAGNVGALDRSNYTVLGDNVNLAARLEGANKEYDTSIMISEATFALVSGKFVTRELDKIRVVGKKVPVRIFELIAVAGAELPMSKEFLDAYAAAMASFKERRWAESIQGFQRALELKPGDTPSKTYIERAKVFQMMPPAADWEGVFELTSK